MLDENYFLYSLTDSVKTIRLDKSLNPVKVPLAQDYKSYLLETLPELVLSDPLSLGNEPPTACQELRQTPDLMF